MWYIYDSGEHSKTRPKRKDIDLKIINILSNQKTPSTINKIRRLYEQKHGHSPDWTVTKNKLEALESRKKIEKEKIGKRHFYKIIKQKKIQHYT